MDKKGELTTQQIVILIVLIMSFAVILFFLFRLNLGKESEQDICHNSVVLRGNSVLPAGSVPLNCQRQYVCLTKDGNCEDLVNPIVKKVDTLDDVYETLANQMQECWWQFGEGKIDYVGKDFFTKDNYCSICSQLAFDGSLNKIEGIEDGKISKDELYNYLSNNELTNGETYSEYLFGTKDVEGLKDNIAEAPENLDEVGTFGEIEIGKQYFNVMGITSEVSGREWKIAAAVVAATVGFFIPGVGWTVTGTIVGALIVGGGEVAGQYNPEIGAIVVEGRGISNNFMAPTIIEANSDKFKALNCEDVLTLA